MSWGGWDIGRLSIGTKVGDCISRPGWKLAGRLRATSLLLRGLDDGDDDDDDDDCDGNTNDDSHLRLERAHREGMGETRCDASGRGRWRS